MSLSMKLNSTTSYILIAVVAFVVLVYLNPMFLEQLKGMFVKREGFCGQGDCGELDYPYGPNTVNRQPRENFSSCYQSKQIYLNSTDEDEPSNHGDVHLENRWGKLYITLNCNLPYVKGGVFNTMWGSYHAFLVDTRKNKSINIGSLVYHGDKFYKLATELLGDYSEYNEIWVYQQTEDYAPKLKLKGSITGQQCSSL